jgi:hypothetical protein
VLPALDALPPFGALPPLGALPFCAAPGDALVFGLELLAAGGADLPQPTRKASASSAAMFNNRADFIDIPFSLRPDIFIFYQALLLSSNARGRVHHWTNWR